MGIFGLLKLLGPVTQKEHISSLREQTAAVDIMSWLYKGCYRCAFEHNQNIETNDFLYYILEMLQVLSYYKIRPIMVFDGRYVGKKDETIEKRKRQKEENRLKGMAFLEKGNEEEARKYLSRCIIITERIITLTMSALYTKGVEYMVAPYESDSQIAKLVYLGVADFAITEDSDMLVYNVRTVLKLTQDGECDFIDLSKWQEEDVDTAYLKTFLKMSTDQRIETAVLAGSDYNSSIKGIGIKRAIKHLFDHNGLNGAIDHLRGHQLYSSRIPDNYESMVLESKLIFTFATIYNPLSQCLEFLNPLLLEVHKPEQMDEDELKKIVGPFYDFNEDTKLGRVNARNMQPREITKVSLKDAVSVNIFSLEVREGANRKRREFWIQQRRIRQEERANNPEITSRTSKKQPSRPRKQALAGSVTELTEEERKKQSEQRKSERVQRFSEFKSILNSFAISEQSDDSDSSSDLFGDRKSNSAGKDEEVFNKKEEEASKGKEEVFKEKEEEASKGKDAVQQNQYKEEVQQDQYDEEDSESCSQFMEECLQALNPCLNPWLKK